MTSPTPLLALRDVAGVIGSFLLDRQGSLVARDLPQVVDDELLAQVGGRLQLLCETAAGDDALESVLVAFGEHKLCLGLTGRGVLAAITAPHVHLPTLKMAMSVAGRRLDALSPSASAASGPRATPMSPVATAGGAPMALDPPVSPAALDPPVSPAAGDPMASAPSAPPQGAGERRRPIIYRGHRLD